MANLAMKFPKNFMDCRWFSKLNKNLFLLTMLCQLFQSMGYNVLFDIPQLFMILAMFALFSYRKSIPQSYHMMMMFFIYYIGYSIHIKWVYVVSIDIPIIKRYIRDNPDSWIIQLCATMFGNRISEVGKIERGQGDVKLLESITY